MDKAMQDALIADGEKLKALTGEDHGPNFGWWCPTCEQLVPNEHVTYEETHDTRCGGCGDEVY